MSETEIKNEPSPFSLTEAEVFALAEHLVATVDPSQLDPLTRGSFKIVMLAMAMGGYTQEDFDAMLNDALMSNATSTIVH